MVFPGFSIWDSLPWERERERERFKFREPSLVTKSCPPYVPRVLYFVVFRGFSASRWTRSGRTKEEEDLRGSLHFGNSGLSISREVFCLNLRTSEQIADFVFGVAHRQFRINLVSDFGNCGFLTATSLSFWGVCPSAFLENLLTTSQQLRSEHAQFVNCECNEKFA